MIETLSNLPYDTIYQVGKIWSLRLFLSMTIALTATLMVMSMRFLYFYFIKTGEIFIFRPEHDYTEIIREINREKYTTDLGVAQVWIVGVICAGLSTLAALVWPVAILALATIGIPVGTVVLLAYRKRRKEEFINALKGPQ